MAICVWNRRNAGPHCDFLSPLDSGESALVDDPRSQSRSGTDCRRSGEADYGVIKSRGQRPRLQRLVSDAYSNAHTYPLARNLGRDRALASPAFVYRFFHAADAVFFIYTLISYI